MLKNIFLRIILITPFLLSCTDTDIVSNSTDRETENNK